MAKGPKLPWHNNFHDWRRRDLQERPFETEGLAGRSAAAPAIGPLVGLLGCPLGQSPADAVRFIVSGHLPNPRPGVSNIT